MARRCVFCGAAASSKEHALPGWLSDLAPGDGAMLHTRETGAVSWEKHGFDIQVRQVCRSCNQTWMSDMEGSSKDLVSELALDRRTAPLSVAEQNRLSTWGYKTAVMLALAYPEHERFVPLEHYVDFRETLKPPHGTTILIAGLVPEVEGEARYQTAWARPERLDFTRVSTGTIEKHGYRLSFSVIRLIVQVIWDPYGGRFERPRAYRDVWTRIRPISKGAWPPGRWIAQAGLEDVAGGRVFSGYQH